jgi:Spy/CpxP family protein refolding chaperone
MTTRRVRVMTFAVIVSMILSSIAIAAPGEGKNKQKRGGRDNNKQKQGSGNSMQARLGLSDEQAKQLQKLRAGSKDEMMAVTKAVREKQNALNKLADSGAGEASIRTAANELGKALGDRAVWQAAQAAGLKEILTPEQYEKMKQFDKERRTRDRSPGGKEGRSRRSKKDKD